MNIQELFSYEAYAISFSRIVCSGINIKANVTFADFASGSEDPSLYSITIDEDNTELEISIGNKDLANLHLYKF